MKLETPSVALSAMINYLNIFWVPKFNMTCGKCLNLSLLVNRSAPLNKILHTTCTMSVSQKLWDVIYSLDMNTTSWLWRSQVTKNLKLLYPKLGNLQDILLGLNRYLASREMTRLLSQFTPLIANGCSLWAGLGPQNHRPVDYLQ